jgi:hypothetical protein
MKRFALRLDDHAPTDDPVGARVEDAGPPR